MRYEDVKYVPFCPWCSRPAPDLGRHYETCDSVFSRRQYATLAKFVDIVFCPLGPLTQQEQQRRVEGIAAVQALYRLLPEDTPAHRTRRIVYRKTAKGGDFNADKTQARKG